MSDCDRAVGRQGAGAFDHGGTGGCDPGARFGDLLARGGGCGGRPVVLASCAEQGEKGEGSGYDRAEHLGVHGRRLGRVLRDFCCCSRRRGSNVIAWKGWSALLTTCGTAGNRGLVRSVPGDGCGGRGMSAGLAAACRAAQRLGRRAQGHRDVGAGFAGSRRGVGCPGWFSWAAPFSSPVPPLGRRRRGFH